MKSKTIALFLLLNVISAGSLFASTANAKDADTINQASSSGPSTSPLRLSPETAPFLLNYGGLADVEIHNHTNWSVDVWVDREYEGTLSPHSHMTVSTGSGLTSLSARADCSCGRSVTWNSTYILYAGYTYPWILN